MAEPKVTKKDLQEVLKGLEPEITEDELNEAWKDLVNWCASKGGKASQEQRSGK